MPRPLSLLHAVAGAYERCQGSGAYGKAEPGDPASAEAAHADSSEAMAPITLNLAANFLGLGSAATPFGIEAMAELQKANRLGNAASDDMCMFIALNSSAVELLPTSVLALRAAAGSTDPYCVVLPTFIASLVSASCAALLCRLLKRRAA